MMHFRPSQLRVIALWLSVCTLSFAGVVKDNEHSWVVSDSIAWQKLSCASGDFWLGSGAHSSGAVGEYAIPIKTWTLAIPLGQGLPRVEITNLETAVQNSMARVGECDQSVTAPVAYTSLRGGFSAPYMRDGLRLVDYTLPLMYAQGNVWVQRVRYTVQMVFTPNFSKGTTPSVRALQRVSNPQGARKFGAKPMVRSLRKTTGHKLLNYDLVASFAIGDRDHASFKEDGVYGVSWSDLNQALQGTSQESALLGVSVRSLALLTASADTLPQVDLRSAAEWGDLYETPIQVLDKNQNGIWDAGDSLLFFATGTSLWKATGDPNYSYEFSSSPYSYTRNYYLSIHTGGANLRLGALGSPASGVSDGVVFRPVRAEKDLLLRDNYFGKLHSGWEESSGMEWFWHWANTKNVDVELSAADLRMPATSVLPGLRTDVPSVVGLTILPHRSGSVSTEEQSPSSLSTAPLHERYSTISMSLKVNGSTANLAPTDRWGHTFIYHSSALRPQNNDYHITIHRNGRQQDRFDGYTVYYPWQPQWSDSTSWILPGKLKGNLHIPVLRAPSSAVALRIENEKVLGWVQLKSGVLIDSVSSSADTRWFLYDPQGSKKSPASIAAVEKLPSGVTSISKLPADAEYILISPNEFLRGAVELKNLRQGQQVRQPLNTIVVSLEEITAYFGRGVLNPVGIRNFLRYAYETMPSLRFATMVGNGHADFRLLRSSSPPIKIPTYELEDMGGDDYYTALDSGEAVFRGHYDHDIAVGRIPTSNETDLFNYINKVRDYESITNGDFSNWRNTILLTADDMSYGNGIDATRHANKFEILHRSIDTMAVNRDFQIDVNKLYLMAYPSNAVGRKPEAARDLIDLISQGGLLTFYSGHGSPIAWADEGLLAPQSISGINNRGRTTILGSFACTVGRFDDPTVISLSQSFLTTPHHGAIASIGAMRESFPTPNTTLARRISENIMVLNTQFLGEAINRAKWTGKGVNISDFERYNSEKYVLLGEPVLTMPAPNHQVSFDQEITTLQALQKVKISGKVAGIAQGYAYLQVREGANTRTLTQQIGDSLLKEDVLFQGNTIHSEKITLEQGKFTSEFITPRKIAFGDTNAEIRLWAWSDDGKMGRGFQSSIRIDGTSTYADSIHDTTPPEISFRPCGQPDSVARSFTAGQKVNLRIPACIDVVITDSTGIDFREEADEGLTFEVVGEGGPWHPYPFLEQSGRRAVARMSFSENWEPGTYLFKVRSQDVLGNVATESLTLELDGEYRNALQDVFNAPNPMGKKGTTFYFNNLAPDANMQINIQIFDIHGKLVKILRQAKSGETHWDGRDNFNRLLANGLYYYVVTGVIFPTEAGATKQVFRKKQKLLISR